MAKDELTPMMRQFHDLKAKHPDAILLYAILLFRCGDFYETKIKRKGRRAGAQVERKSYICP